MKAYKEYPFFNRLGFIKILLIVLFTFLVMVLVGSSASADTVYVDGDYSYGGTNDGHLFGVDAFATIQDGIDGGVQGLLLPTSSVDMVVSHWGPESYFATTLSGIGGGFSVWDDTWVGHCVDEYHYITPGTHYGVTLYSSYDPAMPWPDPDWPCVNYLLNHKDPAATKQQVQSAIWYFIDGGYTGPDQVINDMIDDAEANGVNFVPTEGQIVAVLCDAGAGIQKTFIEVIVPESNMECGTVYVSDGVYEESVTIMKSLKLLGSPGATIQPPSVAEDVYLEEAPTRLYEYAVAILGGTYDSGTDMVSGSDTITVEMSGFTINANEYVPVQRWASILCRNVNTNQCDGEASIHDNDLINVDVNGHETFGIICYGDMDILIQSNTVDQFARGGIGVMEGTCEILDNIVIGPGVGVPVTWAPNGVQVGYGAMGTIQGNDVSGCGWPGTDWAGTGIMIVDTSDVLCDDNDVHDNEVGIGVVDFPEELYGPTWAGVVSDITVTNNMVVGNEWGLDIANDASGIIVTNNVFFEQINDAIDVYDYSVYASYTGPAPTNVNINCNEIYDSGGDGLWVGDTVTDTVDAKCNWWGNCSGPYNATWNSLGSGDNVVGNAIADPWVGKIIVDAGGPYFVEDTLTFHFSGTISTPGCCDEILTVEWDFGDGETSSELNPVHTYSNSGSYDVMLTVRTVTLGHVCVKSDTTTGTFGYADPPIIQIATPENGEIINGVYTVSWYAIDDDYPGGIGIPIYLYYKPVAAAPDSWHQIGDVFTNNLDMEHGDYGWDTTGYADGTYYLLAEALDEEGNRDYDSVQVIIGNGMAGVQVSDVSIVDITVGSCLFVRNGDTIEITAGITGDEALTVEDITADLSGFGLGSSVPAESFDGFTATWKVHDVSCVPPDGPVHVTVSAGSNTRMATITADNTQPEVTLMKPLNGLYLGNLRVIPFGKTIIFGALQVQIEGQDANGIARADISIDGIFIETINEEPFFWHMNIKSMGAHTLQVTVYDHSGNAKTITKDITIYNPRGLDW